MGIEPHSRPERGARDHEDVDVADNRRLGHGQIAPSTVLGARVHADTSDSLNSGEPRFLERIQFLCDIEV